jgi:hypothetical protein
MTKIQINAKFQITNRKNLAKKTTNGFFDNIETANVRRETLWFDRLTSAISRFNIQYVREDQRNAPKDASPP